MSRENKQPAGTDAHKSDVHIPYSDLSLILALEAANRIEDGNNITDDPRINEKVGAAIAQLKCIPEILRKTGFITKQEETDTDELIDLARQYAQAGGDFHSLVQSRIDHFRERSDSEESPDAKEDTNDEPGE